MLTPQIDKFFSFANYDSKNMARPLIYDQIYYFCCAETANNRKTQNLSIISFGIFESEEDVFLIL